MTDIINITPSTPEVVVVSTPPNTSTIVGVGVGQGGAVGQAGPTGPTGATGATGPAGPGVPTGGTTGQALVKINSTDYNTQWTTIVSGVTSVDGLTGAVVLSGSYDALGAASSAQSAAISAAATDATTKANAVQTNLDAHTGSTTSVHGISNTANLVATTDTGTVSNTMLAGSITPSKLTYPLATAWVSGTTYAVGDVVTYQTGYYVRRVAGAGTTAPSSDTTNWAVRTQPATMLGAGTATNFVGYNSSSGITAIGMAISTPPATIPSTGLTVSNGSITVSNSTNGITVSGSGGVTTGSGGLTSTGGINVSGTNSGTLQVNTTSITNTPLIVYPSGTPTATGVTITNGTPTSLVSGAGTVFRNLSVGDTLTASGFTTGNGSYTIAQLVGAFTLSTPSGANFTGSGTLTATTTGTSAVYAFAVNNAVATVAGITPKGVIYGDGSSLSNLNGNNLTAGSVQMTAFPAYTGASSTVVTDNTPTISYPALTFPIISSLVYSTQPASTTISATGTLTSAQIFSGILLSSTASAYTSTLPSITTASTGMEAYWTSLNNGVAPPVNTCFEISFINTGTTNAWTITIPTGWTGVPVTTWTIAAAPSATIPTSVRARIVKRSTTAYSIFRLS